MKNKILSCLKNMCQILIGISEGWFSFWWFLYAWVFITDRKDREEIEVGVPLGWTMVIIGVIIIFSIEFIMYRWNKNWKKYFIFHLFPCIATALITYLYLFFL